jgi:hypothetical protein
MSITITKINNTYNNIVNFKNTDTSVGLSIAYTGANSANTYRLTYTVDGSTYIDPSVSFTGSAAGNLPWTVTKSSILNSVYDNENFKIKLTSIEVPADYDILDSRARVISMDSDIPPIGGMTISDIINLRWNNIYQDNEQLYLHFKVNSGADTIYQYNGSNISLSNRKSFPFIASDPTNNINMASGGTLEFTLKSTTDQYYSYTFTSFVLLTDSSASQWKIADDSGNGTMDRYAHTERYELGTRTAGEKALYLDEFLTLGQVELGQGLKGYHREDDGTIVGKDTTAKYYSARNLLIELDPTNQLLQNPKSYTVDISHTGPTDTNWIDSTELTYGKIRTRTIIHNFGLTANASKIQVEIKEKDELSYDSPIASSRIQWEPSTGNTIKLYYVDKSSVYSGSRYWTIKIVEIV